MGSDDVFAITSRGDDIWFGNYAGGLHHLAADGSITHYGHDPGDPDSLPSDTVMSLAFDRAGTLWVGTRAGLAKFQGGRIQRVAMPIEGTPLLYRSEEHTSGLQSLMRISYAVFCLKKKNKHTTYTNTLK